MDKEKNQEKFMALKKRLPIKTDRLEIDFFQKDDITPQYISWLNDPEVTQFSNQRFTMHSEASSKKYFREISSGDSWFLKLIEADSNRTIGTMTVHPNFFHNVCDLGILIGEKKVYGRGLGTEAWISVLNLVEAAGIFRKITAGANQLNLGMEKICSKSGMIPDGERPRQELVGGVETNIKYYAKYCCF